MADPDALNNETFGADGPSLGAEELPDFFKSGLGGALGGLEDALDDANDDTFNMDLDSLPTDGLPSFFGGAPAPAPAASASAGSQFASFDPLAALGGSSLAGGFSTDWAREQQQVVARLAEERMRATMAFGDFGTAAAGGAGAASVAVGGLGGADELDETVLDTVGSLLDDDFGTGRKAPASLSASAAVESKTADSAAASAASAASASPSPTFVASSEAPRPVPKSGIAAAPFLPVDGARLADSAMVHAAVQVPRARLPVPFDPMGLFFPIPTTRRAHGSRMNRRDVETVARAQALGLAGTNLAFADFYLFALRNRRAHAQLSAHRAAMSAGMFGPPPPPMEALQLPVPAVIFAPRNSARRTPTEAREARGRLWSAAHHVLGRLQRSTLRAPRKLLALDTKTPADAASASAAAAAAHSSASVAEAASALANLAAAPHGDDQSAAVSADAARAVWLAREAAADVHGSVLALADAQVVFEAAVNLHRSPIAPPVRAARETLEERRLALALALGVAAPSTSASASSAASAAGAGAADSAAAHAATQALATQVATASDATLLVLLSLSKGKRAMVRAAVHLDPPSRARLIEGCMRQLPFVVASAASGPDVETANQQLTEALTMWIAGTVLPPAPVAATSTTATSATASAADGAATTAATAETPASPPTPASMAAAGLSLSNRYLAALLDTHDATTLSALLSHPLAANVFRVLLERGETDRQRLVSFGSDSAPEVKEWLDRTEALGKCVSA